MTDGSNIERIKAIASELCKREAKSTEHKKEIVSCLQNIKEMLCNQRINKKVLLEKVEQLISMVS